MLYIHLAEGIIKNILITSIYIFIRFLFLAVGFSEHNILFITAKFVFSFLL